MSLDLNAKQTSIKALFIDKLYKIPVYQRPYSWEQEQCETLWKDLTDYIDSEDFETSYFLGNIVLAKSKDEFGKDIFEVVDGQQRIISLSMLIRELWSSDIRNNDLKNCIYHIDSRDEDKILGYRVTSDVLAGQEKIKFEQIMAKEQNLSNSDVTNNYIKNRNYFHEQIQILKNSDNKLIPFIDRLLENVSILPIECANTDKALTIFETINNRGLDLSDGDIFKSKLYQMAKGSETEFIEIWDNLIIQTEKFFEDYGLKDSSPITSLFRLYMYLRRAENDDRSKPIKLRDFFEGKCLDLNKKRINQPKYKLDFYDWKTILETLERLVISWQYTYDNSYINSGITQWYSVLRYYKNEQTIPPIIIFLYKNIDFTREYPCLPENKKDTCVQLIKNVVRYTYAKGLWTSQIEGSTIEDEMYRIAITIAKGELYTPTLLIKKELLDQLDQGLTTRFKKGFTFILTL
ncbi:MAG: DUF262 domain-containing protein, partial [Brevinema sp.]